MTRTVAVLAACTLALSTAGAQASNISLRDTLEARSFAFFTTSGSPGLAVGVWKDGKVVYSRGFGVMAQGGTQPVTPRTVFHMASISKTFVATAVMQLVEQGRLRLDDPITKYLPDFRLRNPSSRAISVRQLLAHTAGMPDVSDYAWNKPEYDDKALERWIAQLKDSSLIAEPGAKWQYSNIGFEVLAHLVAVVSGESFERYVAQHILAPAGMAHSTFLMTDVDSANLATGHERRAQGQERQIYPYNRRHAGSSTMHSGVEDMLRYGILHAGRGTIDRRQILKPDTHRLMWEPQIDVPQLIFAMAPTIRAKTTLILKKVAMALGWFSLDFDGFRVMNHNGGDTGFRSSLMVSADRQLVVVVFANSGANAGNLALELVGAALR
jgi:CubicO group peptidase (beta-lactamase class C family)